MANASFHAKITADARQFIQQVEQANQALQELTKSQKAVEGASGAKSQESKKRKEQKTTQQQAEQALETLHRKEMENINQENQARLQGQRKAAQQGVRKERRTGALPGPTRDFGQEVSQITRKAKVEAQVNSQLIAQKAAVKEAFNEARKIKAERERALVLEKKLVSQGILREGSLSDQERTVENLQRIQKKYNDKVTRIRKEQNRLVKKQKADAQAIARANRDQTEAMITGRYALYDVANLYREIATGAIRVARASAQAVVSFAEYESAFTAVERAATLELGSQEFERVREALVDLSTQIPVTFEEISEIATLGAQMGIATGDLAAFTEQIAAFSAVTGNSIDDTAEKFGRLSSLAKVPSDQFENLASAVIFAGFNAVATEKEILKMAESIAGAATNAGYSASQIVGLSTALSSLAIPPEQARGVILRLFNDIQRAVDGTSGKIGAFANVMGTTEESARQLFRTNPEAFFSSFVGGLSEVENLTAVLDNLGIVETREINVLQRLSGNMDVYNKSLRDANESYTEGTALANAYADTADNLEAKFQRLINAFEALAATAGAGFGEILKPLIEGLIGFVNGIEDFAASDIGQFVVPIVTGLSALVAIFAGVTFASKIATAQILALQVAMIKTGQGALSAMNPISGLTNALRGTLYATTSASGAVEFYTKKQLDNMVATKAITAERRKEIIATNQATIATRGLTAATAVLGAAISGIALIGIASMIFQMGNMNREIGKNIGGIDALTDAIGRDTEAYNNGEGAIKAYTFSLKDNSDAASNNADGSKVLIDSQGDIQEAFEDTAEAADLATIAIGENFKQLLLRDIAEGEPLKQLIESMEGDVGKVNKLLSDIGADPAQLIEAAASDGEDGAFKFLINNIEDAMNNIDRFSPKSQQIIRDLNAILQAGSGTSNPEEALRRLRLESSVMVEGLDGDSYDIARALGVMTTGIQTSTDAALQKRRVMEALGIEMPNATNAIEDFGNQAETTTDQTTGLSKALRDVTDYSSDIGGIFDRIMDIEFGQVEVEDNIADGFDKIAEKAADAAEAIEEANAEILELTADRDVLEYQLSVAERYGDEQRAAVIRAKLAKTDKKLADENEKLADAQSESEMSLEGTSKAARENRDALIGLVGEYGNLIQAAIDSGMEGQELEDYIRSLKEEFIEQAEGVGFSREELVKYEEIFDGFITTVDKVDPRVDIKFDSNISAAEQAFDEYMAKLRAADGYTTTQNVRTEAQVIQPAPLEPIVMGSDVRLFRIGLESGRITPFTYYKMVYGLSPSDFARLSGDTSYLYRAAGGYVSEMDNGGRVRGPGGPTSDSIPTMLSNGEYVIQASAVRSYGVDFMNALNQQRLPMAAMPSNASTGVGAAGSNIVYLSPQDRQLLRQVADRPVNLYADNGKIAQSANAGNVTLAQRGLN